jgi:hypothetical protein
VWGKVSGSPAVVIVVVRTVVSSGAKQRRAHRFRRPGDPALTVGYVMGGEAINVVTS